MNLSEKYRPKTLDEVVGQEHIVQSIRDKELRHFLFCGPPGCVDGDTEFLSGNGWKKISRYEVGDKVLQFGGDNEFETKYVFPLNFIKQETKKLYRFETSSLDQCLSLNHRVVYFHKRKPSHPLEIELKDVMLRHRKNKCGFGGKFKTSFQIYNNFSDINITNNLLRLFVMISADGSFIKGRSKNCSLNLKKKRKIERAKTILNNAQIPFDVYDISGYKRFCFQCPFESKIFPSNFYSLSRKQLKIIFDEVLYWDGNQKKRQYFTTIKENADFIQFVFSAFGFRSSIYQDKRKNKICYTVARTKNKNFSVLGKKYRIKEYIPEDGFQYCFSTPSSYLILRRNNKIFITGNSGKTTIAHILGKKFGVPVHEKNASDERGINVVRNEIKRLILTRGKRIILLDEFDNMTHDSMSALRRMMETPKSEASFVLTANEGFKVIPAIQSRCATYEFKRLDDYDVLERIAWICEQEDIVIEDEETQKSLIILIQQANGDMRKAINTLEKVIDKDKKITSSAVLSFIKPKLSGEALKVAIDGDFEKAQKLIEDAYINSCQDVGSIIKELYEAIGEINDRTIKIRLYRELAECERGCKHEADPILPLVQLMGFLAFAFLVRHLNISCPVLQGVDK